MSQSIAEIFSEAGKLGARSHVGVTVVTNQDNRIVSYAVGDLLFIPAHSSGTFHVLEQLTTEEGGAPLQQFFSDRTVPDSPPDPQGGPLLRGGAQQPFSINATDKLGLIVSSTPLSSTPFELTFILHSFGKTSFRVEVDVSANVLVGVGAPIGNATTQAVYVVALSGVRPPIPPQPPVH